MQVYRDLREIPEFHLAVVTIGTFDGVHRGHQQILEQMKAVAESVSGDTVIITFDPHPREILHAADHPPKLLNTLEEKIRLLEQAGIGHLVVIPFTLEFSRLSPEQFIEDFLVRHFKPYAVIIGYDHRFGHDRAGNIELLEKYSSRCGFRVVEIPRQLVHQVAVSSTRIRQYILEGRVGLASELLGYPYFFSGQVVHGQQLGRSMGYPTANLEPSSSRKLLPADGVYLIRVKPNFEKSHDGLLSIGDRPTFSGNTRQIEAYLFHWNKDLYGQMIEVVVLDFIRPQVRFDSADELKHQMDQDTETAQQLIGGKPAQD